VTEERPTEPDTAESEAVSPPPTEVREAPSPPAVEPPPAAAAPPAQPLPPPPPPAIEGVTEPIGAPPSLIDEHPEILVGAAFLGGIVLANLLRRRGR
jgi:hypothetical protein